MTKEEISEDYEIEEIDIEEEEENTKDPIENPVTIQTLELCLKKLPDYYVYKAGFEWTNYFERCRILVSPDEPEGVYVSNPINVMVVVNETNIKKAIARAEQLMKEKIEELKRGAKK